MRLSATARTIIIRPNIFARKGSGSYYTPDDLVRLIIRETVDPLYRARMEAFSAKAEEQRATTSRKITASAFLRD